MPHKTKHHWVRKGGYWRRFSSITHYVEFMTLINKGSNPINHPYKYPSNYIMYRKNKGVR